jgi:hypothetical protein
MATKSKKPAPVKAKPRPVRKAAQVIRVGGDLAVVVEETPAQVGRAQRHPRTGRPRG